MIGKFFLTTPIISIEEMNDIMKIVTFLEEAGWLIKGVSEIVQNKTIKENDLFFSMLLGASGASSLQNLLTGSDQPLLTYLGEQW